MTLKYGFYDSLSGDRVYNAGDVSSIFDGIIVDGIFASEGGQFVVSAITSQMNVSVASGRAWFNSTWTSSDAATILAVDTAEAVLNRIDIVALEIDKTTAGRINSLKIIKGTPASSPTPPTLSSSGNIYQYALAHIYVGAGVTAITQANITNYVGSASTPFVVGALNTISVEELFAQLEAQFDAWFTNLQNQLDSNQAANLQNQIDGINTELGALGAGWTDEDNTWTYSSNANITGVVSINSDMTAVLEKGMRVSYQQTQALTGKWSFNASSTPEVGSFTMGNIGTPTYTAGKFSNALTLNGTNQALSITDTALLRPTGPFTFGIWLKTSSDGDVFQSYSISPYVAGLSFRIYLGVLRVYVGVNVGTSTPGLHFTNINGTTTLTDNAWHYVVVTFKDNYLQIYIDGELEAADYCMTPVYHTTNYIRIGCRHLTTTDSDWFNGQLDDMYFINGGVLDGNFIRQHYRANVSMDTSPALLTKYGIVTDIGPYSGGATTIKFFNGTDYNLDNATILSPKYSSSKSPLGFPTNRAKWTVYFGDSSNATVTSPTANTWYKANYTSGNELKIVSPIGSWLIDSLLSVSVQKDNTAGVGGADVRVTLANNATTVSHDLLSRDIYITLPTTSAAFIRQSFNITGLILSKAVTTFYVLVRSTSTLAAINVRGDLSGLATSIRLVSGYL